MPTGLRRALPDPLANAIAVDIAVGNLHARAY
jgi:hypothetical protein